MIDETPEFATVSRGTSILLLWVNIPYRLGESSNRVFSLGGPNSTDR